MPLLQRGSMRFHLIALLMVSVMSTAAMSWYLQQWLSSGMAAVLAASLVLMMSLIWLMGYLSKLRGLFRAISGTVVAYRDGDFNFGLYWPGRGELADLVKAHNDLGKALRDQRINLVQRELMLDTMVQNTPVAMLLIDPVGRVILGNIAARVMYGDGRKLEGRAFHEVIASTPMSMQEAFARGGDGMFTVGENEEEEIHHLSRRQFRLNGREHELILLKHMTTELRRQEVQTWKRVIRVISHELNNSLAPIASLAHSGKWMLARGQLEKLPLALTTIEERARHLDHFLRDYASFAKLPMPRLAAVELVEFIEKLRSHMPFKLVGEVPQAIAHFDLPQIEQVLVNLIKNAHESGSPAEEIGLSWQRHGSQWRVEVTDRGQGMSEAALANALLPFYSTKRKGTGLGLALAREIIEAHAGNIGLANRAGGGVSIWITLPALDKNN